MDAKRKRSIQHLRQSRAIVPVNTDTQAYLDRFENSDTSREALLLLQRLRFNPSKALIAAQSKRRRKQGKAAKRNLRGELALNKRKQKISRDRRVYDAAGNVVREEGEGGLRRYKEGEEPRLFTGLADVGGGLAGVGAGLGAIAAALPALAAPAAAAPAGVFNFDPEIERQRLAIQDRESTEANQLAQARLQLEADQLRLNNDRLQAQDDITNRRLDQEQQALDEERRRNADEQRIRAEQAGQALELERERFAAEQEAERQRLQDLRQGGGGREPEPEPQAVDIGAAPGLDPALEELRREYDARLRAQEQRADDDRARADDDRREAAKAQEAQNAEIRALAERAAAAQAQAETIERFLPRLEDRRPAAPHDLSRTDREFFGELVRTMGEGVGQQLEGVFERRFGEQQRAIDDAVIQHLDRTGREGAQRLREAVDDALDELGVEPEPQAAEEESGESGEEAVSRAQLAREARERARSRIRERAEDTDEGDTESEEEEEGYESPGLLPQGLTPREQEWLEQRRAQEGSGTESGEGSGGERERRWRERHARAQERWSRETQQGMEDERYAIRPLEIELSEGSSSGTESGEGSGTESGELPPVQRTPLTESGRLPVGELDWETTRGGGHRDVIAQSRRRGEESEDSSVGSDSDSWSGASAERHWRAKHEQAQQAQREHRERDRPQSSPELVEETIHEGVIGGGRQQEIPAEIPRTGPREDEIATLEKQIGSLLAEELANKPGGGGFSRPGEDRRAEGLMRPPADVRRERMALQDRLRALRRQDPSPEAAARTELLERAVDHRTLSDAEIQEGIRLVDTMDAELGRGGVGRGGGQIVDTGKYPATGWSIANPGIVEIEGINPGGRVNVIGRGTTKNTIRYNTGQGRMGVTSISLLNLGNAINRGDLMLIRGSSKQRPPNLYD